MVDLRYVTMDNPILDHYRITHTPELKTVPVLLVPLPHMLPRPQTSDERPNRKIQKYLPDGLNHLVLPPRSSWVTTLLPPIIHNKPIPPHSGSTPDITLLQVTDNLYSSDCHTVVGPSHNYYIIIKRL